MSELVAAEMDISEYSTTGFKRGLVGGWIHRMAVAISQLVNTVFGGMPDETISCRIYRERRANDNYLYCFLECFINYIFFWEIEHCFLAWCDEVNRRHVHPEIIIEQNKRSMLL